MGAVAARERVVPSTALVVAERTPIRVHVRLADERGARAWVRTNPGPVSVVGVVGVEAVVAVAGIRYGFFVDPRWWAPAVVLGGAWLDWRQRWDERRYYRAVDAHRPLT